MGTLLLAISCALTATSDPVEVRPPNGPTNQVTGLHFGANIEFFRPGLFVGTLPAEDPRSKADAFATALRESGIRTLRVPGGDSAYYYLPEDRALSMELAHAAGLWEFRDDNPEARDFVTLDNLARFAREHEIALIYELPFLFHSDQGRHHASIRSTLSKQAQNYDHDRIEAQADYAAGIIRRLRELHAPVVAWELGNEEFAYCEGADYARVAAAMVERIRQVDAETPIIAVGMGDPWFPECVRELRRLGVLEQIQSFNAHYPFGNWPGPATPAEQADPSALVRGDVQFGRWFDAATRQRAELEIPAVPMAVTETMVFRLQAWDSHRVIGSHAHALLYAWNWMTLLRDPRCNVAVFHDLETNFFGMMRYDVGYDESERRFVGLAGAKPEQTLRRFPAQYVLSPTCAANHLLSRLVGCHVGAAILQPEKADLSVLWGKDSAERIALACVNRSADAVEIVVPGLVVESAESLMADSLGSTLSDQFRVADLMMGPGQPNRAELPAWSVTLIRLHP